MLVIKMLKKASNMNNIELAKYLNKTRNTISSWEQDEKNIPNTEKIRLSNRFEFDYEYWNIGLDRTNAFYQKMYSDIKNGYLRDCERKMLNNETRIEEILRNCDGTYEMIDYYKEFNKSNEYNHYQYINLLLKGIDPIDNSYIDENHFINNYKKYLNDINKILYKFEVETKVTRGEEGTQDDLYITYINKLKKWRKEQAEIENINPFQVLSDKVLENIVKEYGKNNKELVGIKNFPVNGIKWNKYYDILIGILSEK